MTDAVQPDARVAQNTCHHISTSRLDPGARPRFEYLDGLRGVAAVVVVVSHFLSAFVPALVPEIASHNPSPLADTPLAVLWNGRFAVVIFFILSGFVVASSAVKRRGPLFLRLVLRYLRLAIPVLVSVLIAWVLLKLTPGVPAPYLAHPASPWVLQLVTGSAPGLAHALSEGTFRFIVRGHSAINVPIWSMKLEIAGSLLLYTLYRLPGRAPVRLLIVLALLTPWGRFSLYEGFWLGALLRELWLRRELHMRWAPLFFAVGLFLGAPSDGFSKRAHLPHWCTALTLGDFTSLYAVLAALTVVAALFCSSKLQRFFNATPCQFLGRISFALYLLHVPLLSVALRSRLLLEVPSILVLLSLWLPLFLLLSIGLGYIGTVTFDEPVVRFNRRMEKRFS